MYFTVLWNGLFNNVDNKKHVNCHYYICLRFKYYSGCGWIELSFESNYTR